MRAVRLVFRAELRRRWRSWLAIAILMSVVGGFVLASTAAGRRTASAFPRFISAYGFDAAAYATQPVPQLAKLPEVASAVEVLGPLNGQPTCNCGHVDLINPTNFSVAVLPGCKSLLKLVSGRRPNPSSPDQVLASFTLQQDYNVQVGTVIRVPFYAPSQASGAFNATGAPAAPTGPTVALHVVGIEASEGEFRSGTTTSYGDRGGERGTARRIVRAIAVRRGAPRAAAGPARRAHVLRRGRASVHAAGLASAAPRRVAAVRTAARAATRRVLE
jgi:hypothetical protein